MSIDYHLCLAILKEGERELVPISNRSAIMSLVKNRIVFPKRDHHLVEGIPLQHLLTRIQLLNFYQHRN